MKGDEKLIKTEVKAMAKVKVVIESDEDVSVKVTKSSTAVDKLLEDIENASKEEDGCED